MFDSTELDEYRSELAIVDRQLKVHENMHFQEILSILDTVDSGDISIPESHQELLRSMVMSKVDNIRYVIREWEDAANRHAEFAKEHTEKKKAFENRVDRLKSYVTDAMKRSGFEKIAGEEFKISLRKYEVVDVAVDADEALCTQYPNLIKKKFEWSRSSIKDAVKEGLNLPFVAIRETIAPIFTVNSGGKK